MESLVSVALPCPLSREVQVHVLRTVVAHLLYVRQQIPWCSSEIDLYSLHQHFRRS